MFEGTGNKALVFCCSAKRFLQSVRRGVAPLFHGSYSLERVAGALEAVALSAALLSYLHYTHYVDKKTLFFKKMCKNWITSAKKLSMIDVGVVQVHLR